MRTRSLPSIALATLAASCLTPRLASLPASDDAVQPPWKLERAALLRSINAVRGAAGVRPLAYDTLLQRVGDAHCLDLVNDGVSGHFALAGVPPYLRYLLAGGHGYHRENAASRSSSNGVSPEQVGEILQESLARMLAEVPPDDGHRRTILDPTETRVGLGVAVRDGEVRVAQEFAVEVASGWDPPPLATAPGSVVTMAGRLSAPWQPAAIDLLWEPLPQPLTREEAAAISSYAYPPRRELIYANEPALGRLPFLERLGLEVYRDRSFRFSWQTRTRPGVEVAVLWARRSKEERALTAVASACTVVTDSGTLPPALARWAALGDRDRPPAADGSAAEQRSRTDRPGE